LFLTVLEVRKSNIEVLASGEGLLGTSSYGMRQKGKKAHAHAIGKVAKSIFS
jgi:hypothetical protein